MQSDLPSPWDPSTHYSIIDSDSSVSVDGYAKGEPKYLECDACGARVLLTREPTPGIDEINHKMVDGDRCPQEFAHTEYWEETHPDAVSKIMDSLHDVEASRKKPVVADGGRED